MKRNLDMNPKAVVFDLGKVLVDFDYSLAAGRIAARSRSSAEESRAFIDHSPLLCRYETGTITTSEFFGEVCAQCGFTGTAGEFAAYFADIFSPIPEMIQLHADLRRAGIPTYIFSNTNDLAISHIRQRFPFFAHFDGYILSYEHGSMKPDSRLYEVVEHETGCQGAEIVYLDDRLENVEAGQKRNWNAVLHESPEKSRGALHHLGLLKNLV
jgi:epoxide hydrolase-like predicted phosphatase